MGKINNLKINTNNSARDIYLKNISLGNILGPMTGYASVDKPWLKFYSDDAINSEIPDNYSMYEYIFEKNKDNLNRIAINYYGNKFTYNELFEKIDEYASKFKSLCIKKDDIVSICMPTTPETIYSIYALNKLGVVCDMLDPRSNTSQIEYYLSENKSKLLLLCDNYYDGMKESLDKMNLNNVILLPVSPSAPFKLKLLLGLKSLKDNKNRVISNNVIGWKEFEKLDKNLKTFVEKNSKDLALIVHSSGTTNLPKGIVLSNKNVNSIAFQYSQTSLNVKPEDKFLSVIPAFASFGVVASINLPFSLSMENIILPLVNADIFVKSVEKYKPNFTLTIPANMNNLMKKCKLKDLSFFNGPGCGGYSLDSHKEKEINDYLIEHNSPSPMLMGWGMSELSSTASLEIPECSKLLSSGIPLVKNIISIFDPKTCEELRYFEEGEICVSGPSIMVEYLNNPTKTNKTIRMHSDGRIWLHSGDIGYMDNEGRLYPVNRLERMIIRGIDGFKIFPQKIEDVISTSKYVESCVVVGCSNDSGIYPKAYIVLKENVDEEINVILNDIKEICKKELSIRAIPDEFEIISEVPYTQMGKPDYKKLERKK